MKRKDKNFKMYDLIAMTVAISSYAKTNTSGLYDGK